MECKVCKGQDQHPIFYPKKGICDRCYREERRRAKGICKRVESTPERIKEQHLKYRNKNRLKLNKRSQEKRKENPDKYKKYSANWRKNNLESCAERQRRYRKNNRGKCNAETAKYRASKKQATLSEHNKRLQEIYINCPKGMHVDHIIPLNGKEVCGLHVPWNLQYLTAEENIKKSNKVLPNNGQTI